LFWRCEPEPLPGCRVIKNNGVQSVFFHIIKFKIIRAVLCFFSVCKEKKCRAFTCQRETGRIRSG
jgi:hypothetical protein